MSNPQEETLKKIDKLKTENTKTKNKSFKSDAIRRFKQSPTGIIGLIIIALFLFIAVFGPYITPHDPFDQDISKSHDPPSLEHPMGNDFLGRDVFSRVIYGSRISVFVGVTVILIRMLIGIPIGLISGYYGGIVESILMRIVDAVIAFPGIILALAIMAARGQGLENVILALSVTGWTTFARLVRSEVLSLREREYIQAARGVGFHDIKVMVRHILPNCMASIIVYSTMTIAVVIIAEASLSFLGLGAGAEQVTWGIQMSMEREYLRYAWWGVTFPGLAIATIVLGFNLLGDALRDVLDPRLKE
ncbi:ABC transporter permease [Natranaerobius thermophilus]|uniref:Binding-protein-dependent transport systems inner membrane component n=1 Tax=Natranaerobius thermophilus (strain ATCC BAA-1301 / DSM 18059 / JW/NM-WN-LF) TaxID=457570 RepID=B2A2T8_NATTJ|nr:ABC transporter permease [Natranaerobius thermophilus]ACB86306.1 binding-protein-dependent transport systems inner membrane component [Natranaerobius thermophilus JW/NM-WN-LF]